MIDAETREELSDSELLAEAMGHLAESACFAYEIESEQGIAFAVMVDNALRYGQHIMNGTDPRLSQEFVELASLDCGDMQ